MTQASTKVIVSGMRPTGPLHLGHFHGVIANWLKLQDSGDRCYFFVADWHALTTEYQGDSNIAQISREIILDWLALGVNPDKALIFMQSHVPAHAELHVLLSMLTPIGWLERVPSYKELRQEMSDKDLSTYGFLGYPVLQTADVAIYKATHVPVGQDQVAHLELAREIIRRFNFIYGKDLLVECQPLLTQASKLPGLDGRKMSKSYNNSIYISDDQANIETKLKAAITDPARMRRTDPGNPDVCKIYDFHKVYSGIAEQQEINKDCRSAAMGCVDCKKRLATNIVAQMQPVWERRAKYASQKQFIEDIISAGASKAASIANENLKQVKQAMRLA